MIVQRSLPILIADDADLRGTLDAFQALQNRLSPLAFNNGRPLTPLELHRRAYHDVKGTVNAQMTISAMRSVCAAYAAAKSNRRPLNKPFTFARKRTVFLVGQRGRDAGFRKGDLLSIWTIAGRKRIPYQVPNAFRATLEGAVEVDSLELFERAGRVLCRVTVTLEVPEPNGVVPVGVDLNETNALVAVDADGKTLFVSGRAVKIANKRSFKTRKRLQKKLAAQKAEKRNARSVRRLLKRLGRKRSNRTKTFAQTTAKRLAEFAPSNAVLVFEDLHDMPQPKRGRRRGKALRRRLSKWYHGLILHYARNRAEERGMEIAFVDPRNTSKSCSRCGLIGKRKRHSFVCPHCEFAEHADINAAVNIRNRYTVFRTVGHLSVGPEARSPDAGKSAANAADN